MNSARPTHWKFGRNPKVCEVAGVLRDNQRWWQTRAETAWFGLAPTSAPWGSVTAIQSKRWRLVASWWAAGHLSGMKMECSRGQSSHRSFRPSTSGTCRSDRLVPARTFSPRSWATRPSEKIGPAMKPAPCIPLCRWRGVIHFAHLSVRCGCSRPRVMPCVLPSRCPGRGVATVSGLTIWLPLHPCRGWGLL